jgi:amino acid permease
VALNAEVKIFTSSETCLINAKTGFFIFFMESKNRSITVINLLSKPLCSFKNQLMTSQNESPNWRTKIFLTRLTILCFIVLVGYSLARSIQTQTVIGIILALVSLGASIYFFYLLAKAKEEIRQKETA